MMREIERLSAEGKTAEAQKLLEKMQELMNNLEVQMAQGQQGQGQQQPGQGQQGQGNPDLNSSVEGLSETMGKQRSLRDQTQQQEQSKDGQPGKGQGDKGDQTAEQLAQRQGQLRQGLSQAQRNAQRGGSTQNGDLDRADEAMGKAEQALRRGDLGGARAEQDRALREMRGAADRLAQQSMRDKENPGQDNQQSQTGQNTKRDPLGRAVGRDRHGRARRCGAGRDQPRTPCAIFSMNYAAARRIRAALKPNAIICRDCSIASTRAERSTRLLRARALSPASSPCARRCRASGARGDR